GYLGGKIGPDLTHVGKIRDERDLLESILFPSASFVRSYEPVEVTTTKGRVFNGLVKLDTPDLLVLTVSATEEVRIPRADVDVVRGGKVWIVGAGGERVLSRQERAARVAFLKACQGGRGGGGTIPAPAGGMPRWPDRNAARLRGERGTRPNASRGRRSPRTA